MKLQVTKFSDESTIGLNGHDGEPVSCRFYAVGDGGARVKVDADVTDGAPDYRAVQKAFDAKKCAVNIDDLRAAFEGSPAEA